jgi:U4/U6 small nuclear ribonucleoprotein PRP31
MAPTEMQKQQNRMAFGQAEEEVIVFDETEGLGMINQSLGTGRVRAVGADARNKRTFCVLSRFPTDASESKATKKTHGVVWRHVGHFIVARHDANTGHGTR